jgi:flagellar basal body-associated protein FliL
MKESIKITSMIIGMVMFVMIILSIMAWLINNSAKESLESLDWQSYQYNYQFSSYYSREHNITIIIDNVNGVEYIKTNSGAIIKRETK